MKNSYAAHQEKPLCFGLEASLAGGWGKVVIFSQPSCASQQTCLPHAPHGPCILLLAHSSACTRISGLFVCLPTDCEQSYALARPTASPWARVCWALSANGKLPGLAVSLLSLSWQSPLQQCGGSDDGSFLGAEFLLIMSLWALPPASASPSRIERELLSP